MSRAVQESNLDMLTKLVEKHPSPDQKCKHLKENKECSQFFHANPEWKHFFEGLDTENAVIALSILAIGQGPHLFLKKKQAGFNPEKSRELLKSLQQVEKFYSPIGGIIGYHLAVLNKLNDTLKPIESSVKYLKPKGIDISKSTNSIRGLVREAIEKSDLIAEMYPVGGAGDRMNLIDKETNEPMPIASLSFCGHSLLERLIRDLEAREYLVYKLTGKKLETVVAMMTSKDKRNHEFIRESIIRKNWFGRNPNSFLFFIQPQVPVIDQDGNWLLKEPYQLIFKPGGHGAIWAQAVHDGVFEIFKKLGLKKLLVRQVNNPIGGTDQGILAFLGLGMKENKAFGFASCERIVNANEGMDVIVEQHEGTSWKYALTNIEYTEFKQKGIEDVPKEEGSIYSIFPTNTNILFADIEEVEKEQRKCPIPGLTLNMKTKFNTIDDTGFPKEVLGGRLESTMQNIADGMIITLKKPITDDDQKNLKAFLTYNERIKTISVTKKAYILGESYLETPEGCLLDMMKNAEDLLVNYCNFQVPRDPLSFIFLYNPKLGPIYEIINQKVRNGKLELGSELIIEVPEVDIDGLYLNGSLLIESVSEIDARCRLKNVKVDNKGLLGKVDIKYWETPGRKESLHIILEEGAEFEAENILFEGPFEIRVPKNIKATAYIENGSVKITQTTVSTSWSWKYSFDDNNYINLRLDDGKNNSRG